MKPEYWFLEAWEDIKDQLNISNCIIELIYASVTKSF